MLSEKFAVATKPRKQQGKNDQHAGLPNIIDLAIGMHVMVTFNVEIDLDLTDGARGQIVEIVLDEHETMFSSTDAVIELDYPPAYVLVKMNQTKAKPAGNKQSIAAPPLTPAYAFTDYRSQGQTISHVLTDISTPPTG
ncbi:hypothetical protein HYDPIDRAFT_34496 [Hydnomerulius pinastri MD-312]|uniref:Uncharacterized protein n=1 Tax=Hydnomerulius pinastri MD-312 TaxID=994086 RepID=A0A0C9VXR1_9AGAM|nr:hypothetical protein HYDPIDRAFT_34496 [Hydnomerulius pinastri MD-312]